MAFGWKRSVELLKLAGSLGKSEFGRWLVRSLSDNPDKVDFEARVKQAKELVEQLASWRGVFMKGGQMLALEARAYLPDEAVAVLEKLESGAKPMSYAEALTVLHTGLGDRAKRIQRFSQEPIAAASIGQVHTGVFEGRPVAIKIQYPDIQAGLEKDIEGMRKILRSLLVVLGKSDINEAHLFDEIRSTISQETNYGLEGSELRAMRELAKSNPQWIIPEWFESISSETVLSMSLESGVALSQLVRSNALSSDEREYYGDQFLKLYTTEFCDWGKVQTDPNLGNFFLRPKERQLVLLDFGATQTYSMDFRRKYAGLILAAANNQIKEVERAVIELGLIQEDEVSEAKQAILDLIMRSIEPFRAERFDFSARDYPLLMRRMSLNLIRSVKKSAPPHQILFLHRKLGGIYQILGRLAIQKDLRPYLEPFQKLMSNNTGYAIV